MEERESAAAGRKRLEDAYRNEKESLLARARRSTRSAPEAEDMVQDVFARALVNVGALANIQNLGAFLFRSLGNRLVDAWRADRRKDDREEPDAGDGLIGEIVAASGLDPLDAWVQDQLADALADAIEALPAEQRLVIRAQVYDGMTFRALSEATGIPLDTLAGRKRYAVATLGRVLADWFQEE